MYNMKKGILILGIFTALIITLTSCETSNIEDDTAEELQGGEVKTEKDEIGGPGSDPDDDERP